MTGAAVHAVGTSPLVLQEKRPPKEPPPIVCPRAGVGVLAAALLAPPLCLDVVLLTLCCGAAVQLVLRFFPEEVDPDVAVYSLCLREALTSVLSNCAAVLKSSPRHHFPFLSQ